ncbi:MAG TPA: hypothetical protein VG870_01800 [Chitinophagaceae bacterium]|nr:hypothetical protein [Chitinophagaceae bacterium]
MLKGTATRMTGVPLPVVLSRLQIACDSPKALSRFYFVFVASDGYRVVYSWNELFNSPTGEHTYLVLEKEGHPLTDMPDRILVFTQTDLHTGRRYLKGLSRIEVCQAR